MPQKPWEKYQQPGPWSKYQAEPNADILAAQASKYPTSAEMGGTPGTPVMRPADLLSKAGTFVAEEGPAMAGGAIGAAVGAPLGPPGIAAGAAFGGAAGEAVRQLTNRVTGRGSVSPSPQEAAQRLTGGAVTGLTQEVLSPAFGRAMTGAAGRTAATQVEKLLKPSTDQMRADLPAISAQLAKEMPIARTAKELTDKLGVKLDGIGRAVENAYTTAAQQFPKLKVKATSVRTALQAERDALYLNGKLTPGQEAADAAYNDLIGWFDQNPSFSLAELRKNKQLWDQVVRWGRSTTAKQPATEEVYEAGANYLRGLIHDAFPSTAAPDRQFSMWKTAYDAASAKSRSSVGKELIGVGQIARDIALASGGGGFAFGYTGAGVAGAVTGATEIGQRLMQTTAYRTASIAAKKNFIRAMNRGDIQAMTRLIAGTGAAATQRQIQQ